MLTATICCISAAGPLFYKFNHWLLAAMVRLLPYTDARMNFAEFFMINKLVSGFWFALACYYFWSLRDERTAWRRARILEASAACATAAALMLAIRPFFGALPPVRTPEFQQLFPAYLWEMGSGNSFPSHSTLVYFAMAAGLWPIHRRISAILCGWVLLAISFPRVYIGGHYPTDVIASMLIAVAALAIFWRLGRSKPGVGILERLTSGGTWIELAIFLWLFELGEGFRSALQIAKVILRDTLHLM